MSTMPPPSRDLDDCRRRILGGGTWRLGRIEMWTLTGRAGRAHGGGTIPGKLMDEVLTRHRFTVEEYHRLGEVGILSEDSRIELIAGDIVVREPIGSYHAGAVNRLNRLWTSILGELAVVQVQNPVELAEEDTEVQPDVTLLRPRADFYATRHPVAADVLLLIEVADTSLPRDRRVKMPLYAGAGVGEAWIVDLTTDRVEVHRDPAAGGYGHVRALGRGEIIAPKAFPHLTIAIADLLG
jgi:Uma2 family endonuclease